MTIERSPENLGLIKDERKIMGTEEKLNTIFFKSLSKMIIIISIMSLQACMPKTAASSRKALLSNSNSTTTRPDAKLPTFTEGNNFIQNGGQIYSTAVSFDIAFSDTLQLRGKDVDLYIRNNGTQNITCLTGRFSDDNQIILLAALPHSVYNFTTKTLEYYYSLAPSDEVTNKNFCLKNGLINKLFALYPLLIPAYKMNSLCPNNICSKSSYISKSLEIYTQSGSPLTQIGTNQLQYTLTNQPGSSTPIGKSCVGNAECSAIGYDCCSLGQCIKDLAIKPGVDKISNDYVQALQDILNNPNHIYLYPQYYYICSTPATGPTTTPSGTASTDPGQRIRNLTNLYNCTNKIEGEMGICTKTISNAEVYVNEPSIPTYNAETDSYIYSSGNNAHIYEAKKDDRNFAGTYTNQSTSQYSPTAKELLTSIQEVSFGEVTLFNYDQIAGEEVLRGDTFQVSDYLTIKGHHNDNVSTGAQILIKAKPPGAVSNELVIKYRNDASCTQVNVNLGKCEKYYIQGQQKSGDTLSQNRRGRVTDHFPASNIFLLPYYANTNRTIKVEVDGITQRQDLDWQLNSSSPANIEFLAVAGALKVFDGQKVKITYYVDLSVNHVMDSKLDALAKIKDICHCADLNCGINPVKNTAGVVTDYSCVYPDPAPITPPISQTIFLSSKTVPVRYFDQSGTSIAVVNGDTSAQEGVAFAYRKDNLLNPNNISDITSSVVTENPYIGFNEIYGSLSYKNNSAKPAKEVPVKKGTMYDIYVDNGTYSNCVQCGNDYYSLLNRMFPLTQFGGGLVPLQARTDRSLANGIPADDMSFGRACFVPATMLPFSHAVYSNAQDQRLNRMRAQHFLYANGYQRDWYGFDYGAVIGSFDGVKWFAIGSNRRIKADGNKLFIAVNGAFGDLALENTFTVTINDGSLNPVGTNMVTSDITSNGAECQKFHQCTTDNDCATTLGWDYACASVNEITTSWPRFDDNGKEIPDAVRDDNNFASILGISTAGKRCVYRGKGAACTQNYLSSLINLNSTFNQTQTQAFHSCSSNNYCQAISTRNVLNPKFNNRIARFGKVRTDSSSDSFGLGAKITGRPLEYNGIEAMRAETVRNFTSNRISGVCVPGRSPESDIFVGQNSSTPSADYMGDKILGIGMSKNSLVSVSSTYLASCGIMDNTNNYFYNSGTPNSSNEINADLITNSGAQTISTNALKIFEGIFNAKGNSFNLLTNNSSVLSSQTFTQNRCMRAPGASCFSDLDCAPSKFIADKIKTLNTDDADVTAILNKYEVKFWQEELICSQEVSKNISTYSSRNNRCCRDVGKTISLPSSDISNNLDTASIPGISTKISDKSRYSRVATVYKDQINDHTNFPKLLVAINNQCAGTGCLNTSFLTNQYKTFSAYAERTSCTGDWVRNFDNGNHKWDDKSRLQSYSTAMFASLNWSDDKRSCAGLEQNDPACTLIQTSPNSGQAKAVLNIMAQLELMGIPQIAMETQNQYTALSDEIKLFLSKNIYAQSANADNAEYFYSDAGSKVYSAGDITNFRSMKKIFKADEVATCYQAGTTMNVGADPNLCCTGFINSKTNRCQLPDFVDVSVYTNRYVSSEAKKLNPSLFDINGYVKDPSIVARLACEKSICASGVLAFGVLISNLKTPGLENIDGKHFRYLQSAAADDANGLLTIFNKGLKLNTHAYCFPASANSSSNGDFTTISCSN